MWRRLRAGEQHACEQPAPATAEIIEMAPRDGGEHTAIGAASEEGSEAGIVLLLQHAEAARYAALALVGPADADDAVQEALVRGWRAWATLRDPAAARAWLVRITVNVCREWRRGRFGARVRLTEPLERLTEGDRSAPALLASDPGASDHTAALDLRSAIERLDEGLRIVVVLRYYAGLDATEIGDALGIPASTVRTRLGRALTLLRAALGDSGERPANSRQEDANAS